MNAPLVVAAVPIVLLAAGGRLEIDSAPGEGARSSVDLPATAGAYE
jgi:hypothetical protein